MKTTKHIDEYRKWSHSMKQHRNYENIGTVAVKYGAWQMCSIPPIRSLFRRPFHRRPFHHHPFGRVKSSGNMNMKQ